MNAPSVAARGPMTDLDLETMWQGCPLFPQLFVIYLCHCFTGHFFLFQETAFQTVDFQWMFHYFGTQSTMQGEGWSIMMSNGSSRVWSSVAAGLHRPGCSVNFCWATGPLQQAEIYPYISENSISHVYLTWYCLFDLIWIIQETVDILGLQVQLIILNSDISANVKEPVLTHLEMELTQRQTHGWTY